jgi:predicted alpha/beta superfamily hydrolase
VQTWRSRIAFEGTLRSAILGTERVVRIYLPPSYDQIPQRRFPVLYLQDGQNAFTTAGEHVAFGWGNWQLDRTADDRAGSAQMRELIMVAVDCSAQRYLEYRGPAYPYSPAELAARKTRPPAPGSDAAFARYSQFLVDELKPKIDREYRTRPGSKDTALLGSSMGGIFSLALAWQRPDVFGGAASLSGAFQVERRQFLLRVLRTYQGRPKPIRVYLDSGVVDYSGGDDGCKHTTAVANELRRIGWRDGIDLLHFVDGTPMADDELARRGLPQHKWAEARTSQHNEFYWRSRAWRALTFLFPSSV